ncbi:MAG: hypothetical protein JWN43_1852, partial [Gammaproteobacteria bacterium]|nr:hypothetical protein [Gammaproteobacteria bacterium]
MQSLAADDDELLLARNPAGR